MVEAAASLGLATKSGVRPVVTLMPGRHKRVAHGYPWVYSNEIRMDPLAKALPAGSLVVLAEAGGRPLGVAMFNPHTLIAARLLAVDPRTAIDTAFVAGRLRRALALRERLYDRPFYRLIHAEADGLPALIIDRFGAVVTVQANAAGSDRLLPEILAALEEVLKPQAIVLRHDSAARTQEGLADDSRVAAGAFTGPLKVEENGCTFLVDPEEGQKTGWFYDQRDNRAFIASLSRGARVLDVYTYAGGFALACAKAGARQVVAIDRSAASLELATAAARENGLTEKVEFRRAEAFDALARMAAAGERFETVIVDPPAFVKSRKDLAAGAQGYRKLARLAAPLVAPGGFLLAASCSHHMDTALFAAKIAEGLTDAGRTGRILRAAGAAPDHPVHPLLPESAYLKAEVLQLD